MVFQKSLLFSCQLTDPYYFQICAYICNQIIENASRKKLGTRPKNGVSINMIFLYLMLTSFDQDLGMLWEVESFIQLDAV